MKTEVKAEDGREVEVENGTEGRSKFKAEEKTEEKTRTKKSPNK